MRWRGQEDECGKEAVIVKCYNQRDVYAKKRFFYRTCRPQTVYDFSIYRKRPVVLIGPPNIGRHELRQVKLCDKMVMMQR